MTITIGSQTNVPDPGAPITSPWAQDTARKLVHTFTNAAARDAWTTRPEGAMAVTMDTDRLWLWNGTAWQEVIGTATGDGRYVRLAGATTQTVDGSIVAASTQIAGAIPTPAVAGSMARSDGAMASTVVGGGAAPNSLPNIVLNRTNSPAHDAGGVFIRFDRTSGGTNAGMIAIVAGGGVGYQTASDERLKVYDGAIIDAAERVQRLAELAFRGRWRDDDGEAAGDTWDLMYAHDIAAEAPYAVTGERDATGDDGEPVYQQVNFPALVPLLVAALGDALERIAALEAAA
jgi:hypothetical protein